MPVTDLKRDANEKRGPLLGEATADEGDDYFYGLNISLEEPELKKLGMTKPEVGQTMKFEGEVKVTSFTDDEGGRSARLTITSMGITGSESGESKRENLLYEA